MKRRFVASALLLPLLVSCCVALAQDKVAVVAPTSEAAEGLDLRAVGELFGESKNLEDFEKALNDPELGVNNLDLDDNGQVDFIRVVEEVAEGTHVIILQVPLGKDEFQDVATIEVEKAGEQYNMQVTGNEIIYGADYYVVTPPDVGIVTWPIIPWIYAPVYRPYRSVFYFGYYPRWWRPYPRVTVGVYRTRTVRLTGRTTFTVTKTRRVTTVSKVSYHPHTSTRVTRRTTVTHTPGKTTVKTKTTRTKKRRP